MSTIDRQRIAAVKVLSAGQAAPALKLLLAVRRTEA